MSTIQMAQVGEWVRQAKIAEELIFKESVQEIVHQLTEELNNFVYLAPPAVSGYKRTGFLRASLIASKDAMPMLSRPNPGAAVQFDPGPVELVILGTELGETIYLGYTANYGAYVHYGANGKPGRPWVDMVAQRWPAIVDAKAEEIKARLGL